jgi:ribonucleoside-triphosphate reductase
VIPVEYPISAYRKIQLEAPYHELENGGHICYVELDGDTTNNLSAFESVVRAMKEAGVGYGAINHPVDRCRCCGYHGIINETCPQCGALGNDENIARIRRITGYLVGTLDRFNNAKRAEEHARVKHGMQR